MSRICSLKKRDTSIKNNKEKFSKQIDLKSHNNQLNFYCFCNQSE